ncbi:hydroquinone glucosyltransferase [Ranunculus cassubicifolius]
MSRRTELVIVPSLGPSHIVPAVEFTKRLIQQDPQISATFLIISSPRTPHSYIDSVTSSVTSIRFIFLPSADPPPQGTEQGIPFLGLYIQNHQPFVKDAITKLISDSTESIQIRLVLDLFSSTMIEVGKELDIPCYVYFTSGAAMLGLFLHLPNLDSSSSDLTLPSYENPVPVLALPNFLLNKNSDSYGWALKFGHYLSEARGVIVNSVRELEAQAVDAFDRLAKNDSRLFMVGPILDLEGKTRSPSDQAKYDRIMKWLDDQPESSVVFLCFGSRGTLSEEQVKELAKGLEQSGHRFLWSLRRPSSGRFELPSDYTNPQEVLPEGFLDRVDGKGLICGWAPQVDVLAHKATGAFVSHCGWNSTLESIWFRVPLLTWPLDAEQKMNAFQLVKDLGLGVQLKAVEKDFVMAGDIEKSVRLIMEGESDLIRSNVKEMSEKCRKSLMEGGSSLSTLGSLIKDLNNGEAQKTT